MATFNVTIPNGSPVLVVLAELAARDGFQPTDLTPAARAAAIQQWITAHIRRLYRDQVRAARQSSALSGVDATLDTEAQAIS